MRSICVCAQPGHVTIDSMTGAAVVFTVSDLVAVDLPGTGHVDRLNQPSPQIEQWLILIARTSAATHLSQYRLQLIGRQAACGRVLNSSVDDLRQVVRIATLVCDHFHKALLRAE